MWPCLRTIPAFYPITLEGASGTLYRRCAPEGLARSWQFARRQSRKKGDADQPEMFPLEMSGAASVTRVIDSCPRGRPRAMTCKAGENPVRGVRAYASEFVQRGWRGEFLLGDKQDRSDHSGDRAKNPAMKSSTMKGPTAKVREGLPVRLEGDGAESRSAAWERYPKLLFS
jgi:hypothetical protein